MPSIAKNRPTKKAQPVKAARQVVFPHPESTVHSGDSAITDEYAKEILGWQEEDPSDKKNLFGNKHVTELSRLYGKKVRFTNNVTNRPLYSGTISTLKQEILRKRWRFNGEPIIIGVTGLLLNGQHTLLALILAVKEWQEHPDNYPQWKEAPTIDKVVTTGVPEDDATVNTMDTCKPRSLADVIYRAAYFKGLKAKEQETASEMLAHCIKMLWNRTGQHMNALGVKQTHAESIAYLDAHPRLLKAVKHVFEEDGEGKVSKFLSPGYSSAAMYLMGCSSSDPEMYYAADNPNEDLLDWDRWDRACEFFVELASGSKTLQPVRDVLTQLHKDSLDGKVSWQLRWAVLAKAWRLFAGGQPVTLKGVQLKFEVKDEVRHLAEEPLLGGIDIGEEGLEHVVAANDPTPEQITNGTKRVQEKRNGKVKQAVRAGDEWVAGDKAWVHTKGEEPYFATLNTDPYACSDDVTRVMVDAEEGQWEVDVNCLSLAQFEMK